MYGKYNKRKLGNQHKLQPNLRNQKTYNYFHQLLPLSNPGCEYPFVCVLGLNLAFTVYISLLMYHGSYFDLCIFMWGL